jgi:hypothetical protein
MNLPGGRLASVSYAPIAQFCSATESGEGLKPKFELVE